MRTSVDFGWPNCVPENLLQCLSLNVWLLHLEKSDIQRNVHRKSCPGILKILSSSAQACPDTPSYKGMDRVSTLTCSISHFRNRSGSSTCFLRIAKAWARYMWGAVSNNSLKYWCSLRNPSLLCFPPSHFLVRLKIQVSSHTSFRNCSVLCCTMALCSSGAEGSISSHNNFLKNVCSAVIFFTFGASEHYSNINMDKHKIRTWPK